MNLAATQDLRSFGLTPTLAASSPAPRRRRRARSGCSSCCRLERVGLEPRRPRRGRRHGRRRRAGDLGRAVPRLVDAVMGGVLGPQLAEFKTLVGTDNSPRTGFTNGAINHVDKELRTLTGTRFREPYRIRFCGEADACRAKLWQAMEETGAALEREQGTADPDAWKADANAERISFAPGLLPLKIRYTNRPSGIQQLATFTGHRPRR
jgi:hypothetical protein